MHRFCDSSHFVVAVSITSEFELICFFCFCFSVIFSSIFISFFDRICAYTILQKIRRFTIYKFRYIYISIVEKIHIKYAMSLVEEERRGKKYRWEKKYMYMFVPKNLHRETMLTIYVLRVETCAAHTCANVERREWERDRVCEWRQIHAE